ncbi:MAG: InlB B-repeat-containing protein [Bacillaceae bacterium]|nr:InlB B-repeat-containing protein [Bacillaceae bacterium]
MDEKKGLFTKKRIGILSLILLLLISTITYFSMQWAEAKEIREYLDLGNRYYDEGQYEEAIIAFTHVLELDERNVDARIGLAKSYRALAKLHEAEEVLIAGIQILSQEAIFYLDLVDLYLAQGNILEAINILDQGLSHSNDSRLVDRHTQMSQNFELIVDQTLLQIEEVANMQLVYYSSKENEDEEVNSQDRDEAATSENEDTEEDSNQNQSEETMTSSEKKTTNVSAVWSLSTEEYGSLKEKEGEVNNFTASAPGNVQVTATVGSIEKSASLEVRDQVLRSIEIETSASTVQESEVVELTAKGLDAKGELIDINPTWQIINSGFGTLSNTTGTENTFTTNEVGVYEIIVAEDDVEATVTITVEKREYTLTKVTNGSGTIRSSSNSNAYTDGEIVTLTATPDRGWEFTRWSGDASGTNPTTTVKMDGNKRVEAVFTKIPEYKINTSVQGNGSISRSPSSEGYARGTRVTLAATPFEGWKFERWEGDVNSTNQQVTVTMDANKTVRAVFSRIQQRHRLTTEVNGQGSISRSQNNDAYNEGTEVRLTATPREGWKFDRWSGDATGSQSTITVKMDKAKTVQAIFVEEPKTATPAPTAPVTATPVERHTLQTSVEGEGTVQKQPSQESYEHGKTVQITAVPKDGWKFERWTGDVSGTSRTVSVEMNRSKTVKAIFVEVQTFTLQMETEGNGTVRTAPSQERFESGTMVSITATPEEGWTFLEWVEDITGSSNPATIQMDSNKIVKAVFVENGTVKGTIRNARTGNPASEVIVKIRKGENVETGSVLANTTTNNEGSYELQLPPGTYTMELSSDRYNKKYETFQVRASEMTIHNTTLLPKSEEISNFSVVLTWGERPRDLDAHLTGPRANGDGRFHVFYGNRSYTEGGVTYAELDVDETGGNGVETITSFREINGIYRYSVHNFSNEMPLAGSGAKVELYKEGNLIRTFRAPAGGSERYWHVFEIENGSLRQIDRLSNERIE